MWTCVIVVSASDGVVSQAGASATKDAAGAGSGESKDGEQSQVDSDSKMDTAESDSKLEDAGEAVDRATAAASAAAGSSGAGSGVGVGGAAGASATSGATAARETERNKLIRTSPDAVSLADELVFTPLFSAGLTPLAQCGLVTAVVRATTPSGAGIGSQVAALPTPLQSVFPDAAGAVTDFAAVSAFVAGADAYGALDTAVVTAVGWKNVAVRRFPPSLHAARRAVTAALLHVAGALPRVLAAAGVGAAAGLTSDAAVRDAWSEAQTIVVKARSAALESADAPLADLPSQADKVAMCATQVQTRALFVLALDVSVRAVRVECWQCW